MGEWLATDARMQAVGERCDQGAPPRCLGESSCSRHGTSVHPRDLRDNASLIYGFLLTGNQ
jgi:hypothetical protein